MLLIWGNQKIEVYLFFYLQHYIQKDNIHSEYLKICLRYFSLIYNIEHIACLITRALTCKYFGIYGINILKTTTYTVASQDSIANTFRSPFIRIFVLLKLFSITFYKGSVFNTKILNSLEYNLHCCRVKVEYLNTEKEVYLPYTCFKTQLQSTDQSVQTSLCL